MEISRSVVLDAVSLSKKRDRGVSSLHRLEKE